MDPTFIFDEFRVDVAERRLTRAGEPVPLQPKTFDLLVALLEQSGSLVGKEVLFARVWPDVVVTDASLARSIKDLRKALGDSASKPRFIETVPKAGYRFVGPVRTARNTSDSWPFRVAATGLLLFAIGASALFWFQREDERATGEVDVATLNADRLVSLGEQALALRTSEEVERAQKYFTDALALDPTHGRAMAGKAIALLHVFRANPYLDKELRRQIISLAERALDIDASLAHAYAAKGLVLQRDIARYDEAKQMLQRAVSLDPAVVEAYTALATIAVSEGDIDAALGLQRDALSHNPNHATLTGNLATSLARAGRYEEAHELLDAYEQLPQAGLRMRYPRELVLSMQGRHIDLGMHLWESLELAPHVWRFARELANLLAGIGDSSRAHRILEEFSGLCEPEERRFYAEAGVRFRLQQIDIADAKLSEFADQQRVRPLRARLAMQRGDFDLARRLYREAFPTPQAIVGWQGDFAGPATEAQRYAYLLMTAGDAEDARKYLRAIAEGIELRRNSGFRSYWPLRLLEARNAALLGQPDRSVRLLSEALDEGWLDTTELDSPVWLSATDQATFAAMKRRIEEKAATVRLALAEQITEQQIRSVAETSRRNVTAWMLTVDEQQLGIDKDPQAAACLQRVRREFTDEADPQI